MEARTIPSSSLGEAAGLRAPLRLAIEGWRFLPHSYALVAQAHSLCLLRRPNVELRFRDLPFYASSWRRTRNVLAPADEDSLERIASVDDSYSPDATLRFHAGRIDASAPPSGTKLVFCTPEYRRLTPEHLGDLRFAKDIAASVGFLSPSRWAALAFERFGVSSDRVHVVPHGVDPHIHFPDAEGRAQSRQSLGVNDAFVFMSIGAMTWNKGIDVLLRAFADIAANRADVRLVLKGTDALYGSRDLLREAIAELPSRRRETVIRRLVYHGETLSARAMGKMLRAADCYVSPYRAEAFNMPVLEAAACGVPLICTSGGPTDDFTDAAFARRIDSRYVSIPLGDGQSGDCLEPDASHLVSLMRDAVDDRDALRAMGSIAALHALRDYTWEAVTDRLLDAVTARNRSR